VVSTFSGRGEFLTTPRGYHISLLLARVLLGSVWVVLGCIECLVCV